MSHPSFDEVSAYIKLSNEAVSLLRNLSSFLPKGKQTDDLSGKLADVEKALKMTEVQLAQSLGYKLCQCTFPPQIMLSKGRHPTHDEEIFKCGNCQKQQPSEEHFRSMDRMKSAYANYDGGRI